MTATRTMTKSPRTVAQQALRLAQESLPTYSSKFSRKDFTQHLLFALLRAPPGHATSPAYHRRGSPATATAVGASVRTTGRAGPPPRPASPPAWIAPL